MVAGWATQIEKNMGQVVDHFWLLGGFNQPNLKKYYIVKMFFFPQIGVKR